jgi:hypothetical protein
VLSSKALQAAYGRRFEKMLESSPDPKTAMDEMAAEAVKANLIDSTRNLRRSSPQEFVSDLWTENPVVRDRLNLNRENLPKPSAVKDLATALDVLQ